MEGHLLALLQVSSVQFLTSHGLVFNSNRSTKDGTCVRDHLHIMDLAAGHLLAREALSPESKKFGQGLEANFKAYNLGRGRGMCVLQIVEAMRKAITSMR